MKSARGLAFALGLLIAGGVSNLAATTPSAQQAPGGEKSRENAYDGNWWLAREVDERYGFMDGVSDCLAWVAHVKGPHGTGYQYEEKITRYYEIHRTERGVRVLDIWSKVARESPAPKRGSAEVAQFSFLRGSSLLI